VYKKRGMMMRMTMKKMMMKMKEDELKDSHQR
jgi:hypothetical protein